MPTLLDWLVAHYPNAKRQTFKRMLQSKRVRVNGQAPSNLKLALTAEDRIEVLPHGSAEELPARTLGLPNVFEDDDLLVIDKPVGLISSSVAREKRPTAWAKVQRYLAGGQPGLIHRLDRDASGLLVFSKNDAAYRSLKQQFFDHTVRRIYAAIVHGSPIPPADQIQSRLIERTDGLVCSTRVRGKGKPAVTQYTTLRQGNGQTLLRVQLQTGRKHQIRAHLSERGYPIVNELFYGTAAPTGRLMLAAIELQLTHPRSGAPMHWQLPIPPELLACVTG